MQRYRFYQGKLRRHDEGEWVPWVDAEQLRREVLVLRARAKVLGRFLPHPACAAAKKLAAQLEAAEEGALAEPFSLE